MPTQPPKKKFVVVDLFCGGGLASLGAERAVEDLNGEISHFIAVNHWDTAIATHEANHPRAEHYCEKVENVRPDQAVPGGRVNLLLAAPECRFHSRAAGARPINDQSRISAWGILDWLHDLYVDVAVIENVPELLQWGPLNADGSRNKRQRGKTFLAFIAAIEALGYNVRYRILNAADYGGATSRERLFIMCKRKGQGNIVWPEPTHAPAGKIKQLEQQASLTGSNLRHYRAAREIIDWAIPGQSIFNRERPLSPNTMRRIYAGLFKFGLREFVLPNEGIYRGNQARSVDDPLNTVTGERGAGHLVQPFVIGQQSCAAPRSVEDPLPTIATAGAISLIKPVIVQLNNNCDGVSIDKPLPTVTTGNHFGLAQPYLIGAGGPEGHRSPRSVDSPLPTVTGTATFGVVEPFLLNIRGGDDGYLRGNGVDEPVQTITTNNTQALIEPYIVLVSHAGEGLRGQTVDSPLQTITGAHNKALVEPYLIAIDQTGAEWGQIHSADHPVPTITTKNRLGVVQPYLVEYHAGDGHERRTRSVEEPLPTQDTSNRFALLQPWLVKYYGTGVPQSVEEPLDTVTTKDRFALCVPVLTPSGQPRYLLLDILFRMLEPHEHAAAMGVPSTYRFVSAKKAAHPARPVHPMIANTTKKEAVKMIGNGWSVELGTALCRAAISNLRMARSL